MIIIKGTYNVYRMKNGAALAAVVNTKDASSLGVLQNQWRNGQHAAFRIFTPSAPSEALGVCGKVDM